MKTETQELLTNTVKASPAVAVAGLTIFGMTLSDLAYLITAIYTGCLLLGWLFDRGYRAYMALKEIRNVNRLNETNKR